MTPAEINALKQQEIWLSKASRMGQSDFVRQVRAGFTSLTSRCTDPAAPFLPSGWRPAFATTGVRAHHSGLGGGRGAAGAQL